MNVEKTLLVILGFLFFTSANAAEWDIKTREPVETNTAAGQIHIASQRGKELTVFHTNDNAASPPGNWTGLVTIGLLIDGISTPPTNGAVVVLEYASGYSRSLPLNSEFELDPADEVQVFIRVSGLATEPEFVGASGELINVVTKSNFEQNSKGESVFGAEVVLGNAGAVFVSATRQGGTGWPNRTVTMYKDGSTDAIGINGNYLTVLPKGYYIARIVEGMSLGDCGRMRKPPEHIRNQYEIDGLSCQHGQEIPWLGFLVVPGLVSVIEFKLAAESTITENLDGGPFSADEARAIIALRKIYDAQVIYHNANSKYAESLTELNDESLVEHILGSGCERGYVFDLNLPDEPATLWRCDKDPRKPGSTGRRMFYLDQSGVIRTNSGDPAEVSAEIQ